MATFQETFKNPSQIEETGEIYISGDYSREEAAQIINAAFFDEDEHVKPHKLRCENVRYCFTSEGGSLLNGWNVVYNTKPGTKKVWCFWNF